MSELITNGDSYEFVRDKYGSYGRYVNTSRHIPNVYDGLKPSYRKTILSAMEISKDKLVKTLNITANCCNRYSVHGDASINPVVSNLVNAGIFDGQGNHGGMFLTGIKAEPAAPRYTEAKINAYYYDLFSKLLQFVPKHENEHGIMEANYIPTPIPLGLIFGSIGIGFGTGQALPSFTAKSILDAYLHNDPQLLVSSYGLEITNRDQLDRLWTEGKGFINFKYKTYRQDRTVYLEGNCLVIPNLTGLDAWRKQSRVQVKDVSTDIPRLAIERVGAVRMPSIEEIEEVVDAASRFNKAYYIRVNVHNVIRQVGLYDWIDITYKNYTRLMNKYIASIIADNEFKILVYTHFREIADLILNHKELSYEDIAAKVNVPMEVVKDVGSRAINTLRTSNPEGRVAKCKAIIDEYKAFNVDKYIHEVIHNM